jgi:hypothetical protein
MHRINLATRGVPPAELDEPAIEHAMSEAARASMRRRGLPRGQNLSGVADAARNEAEQENRAPARTRSDRCLLRRLSSALVHASEARVMWSDLEREGPHWSAHRQLCARCRAAHASRLSEARGVVRSGGVGGRGDLSHASQALPYLTRFGVQSSPPDRPRARTFVLSLEDIKGKPRSDDRHHRGAQVPGARAVRASW